jgi:hypothetical protein
MSSPSSKAHRDLFPDGLCDLVFVRGLMMKALTPPVERDDLCRALPTRGNNVQPCHGNSPFHII